MVAVTIDTPHHHPCHSIAFDIRCKGLSVLKTREFVGSVMASWHNSPDYLVLGDADISSQISKVSRGAVACPVDIEGHH